MITKPWNRNYPKQVPLSIDIPNITLNNMLKGANQDFANNDALVCHGEKITFNNFDNYTNKFAGFLQNNWQLQKSDHIAIMLPNILQFPIVIFALIKLGCVFININPLYTSREIKGIFQNSKAKGIIVLSALAHNVEAIADLYPSLKKQIISFVARYLKGMKNKYSKDKFDNIAALQYSSGTTGTPKGTILLHRNIVANIYQIKAWTEGFDVNLSEQIVINVLPIYHIFSLTANLFLFYFSGALQILIPNPRDIKSLVNEMRKNNFSTIFGVNTLYIALLNNQKFRKSKFNNFKLSISGSMSTLEAVVNEWKKVTGVEIKEGYGLSEMSPVVTVNSLENSDFNGSVGFPLPNINIKILKYMIIMVMSYHKAKQVRFGLLDPKNPLAFGVCQR